MDARCATHPDRPALTTCERCGAFICDLDRRLVGTQVFCETCATRPEIDYLEQFRLKYWGKRDAWGWLFGVGALLILLWAFSTVFRGQPGIALIFVVSSAGATCYFLGLSWARGLVFLPPVLGTLAVTLSTALSVPGPRRPGD